MLASARLSSRDAARKITAGIARGHVRGRCRLVPEVVVENRVKTTSPNIAKGHDGYFHRGTMSDVFGLLQMACDAATRHIPWIPPPRKRIISHLERKRRCSHLGENVF